MEPEPRDVAARAPDELLLLHHGRFLSYLTRLTGSRGEAEDVLHAAYVRALERGAPDGPEEGVVAWFHAVLRNGWRDRLRRRAAEGRALERHAHETDDSVEPDDLLEHVCDCVRDLVPVLRPEYAEILRGVDLEGRRVDEIARASGITRNLAHVRLHRARQALKRELLRACGACAEHACLDCGCARSAGRPS